MVSAVMQGQQCRNIGIVKGTEVEKVLWQTSEGLTLIVGARVYVRVRARVRVRMRVRVRKRGRMLACACFRYPRAFLFSCMCASYTYMYVHVSRTCALQIHSAKPVPHRPPPSVASVRYSLNERTWK